LQASDSPTTAVAPPPVAATPAARPRQRPRTLQLALFIAAVSWYFCARQLAQSAAEGLAYRFDLGDEQGLIQAILSLFLVIVGIALLRGIERRRAPLRMVLGLPRRKTSREEWATGVAIGWGLAVASVIPMALARTLNVQLWTSPRAFLLVGLSVATLGAVTLAKDMGVHGYAFQRLIDAIGPVRATILMALLAAVYTAFKPGTSLTAITVGVLSSVLLSLCWLRTQGVWLMWGLHFAWAASTGVLFGLPLSGDPSFSSVVDTRAAGPLWLTGGDYGPAAATLSIFFLLAAIPILVRITTDYAWDYTHPPLIPAGYDVTIPPPAAHVAMEEAQAFQPASLIQILPAASPGSVPRPPK
jgi:membrane protease YdiL (CAAX protease family)